MSSRWTCPACGSDNSVEETTCPSCGRWASVFDLEGRHGAHEPERPEAVFEPPRPVHAETYEVKPVIPEPERQIEVAEPPPLEEEAPPQTVGQVLRRMAFPVLIAIVWALWFFLGDAGR